MATMYGVDREERGGFNFDNVNRNNMLHNSGLKFKNAMKTGTTISGIIFKDGVVLGADTRSTNGETVADKNCEKIHYIAPNIYCCGAGTAADTEAVTGASRAVNAPLAHTPARAQARAAAAAAHHARSNTSMFLFLFRVGRGRHRGKKSEPLERDLSCCTWSLSRTAMSLSPVKGEAVKRSLSRTAVVPFTTQSPRRHHHHHHHLHRHHHHQLTSPHLNIQTLSFPNPPSEFSLPSHPARASSLA